MGDYDLWEIFKFFCVGWFIADVIGTLLGAK